MKLEILENITSNKFKIIAGYICAGSKESIDDMNNRTTLNPTEAKDYGLVHTIKSDLFPIDAELFTIGEIIQNVAPFPFAVTAPLIQSFT